MLSFTKKRKLTQPQAYLRLNKDVVAKLKLKYKKLSHRRALAGEDVEEGIAYRNRQAKKLLAKADDDTKEQVRRLCEGEISADAPENETDQEQRTRLLEERQM